MADNPMDESKRLFAETPTGTLFMRAAIPGATGMLISSIYGLIDGILVGRFVGGTAFAAINLAMPFVILAFALGDLIGSGSAVPISISLGKGDEDRANQVFTCATIMNVLTGLALSGTTNEQVVKAHIALFHRCSFHSKEVVLHSLWSNWATIHRKASTIRRTAPIGRADAMRIPASAGAAPPGRLPPPGETAPRSARSRHGPPPSTG